MDTSEDENVRQRKTEYLDSSAHRDSKIPLDKKSQKD